MTVTPTGTDPYIKSADNLGISPDYNSFEVFMKNSTIGTTGQLFWIRNDDATWTDVKSMRFNLNVKDPGFTKYTMDLSANPEWKGIIRQLRFDVVNSSNVTAAESASIDWIRLSSRNLLTGVKELALNNKFRVFPNPASDFIVVESKVGSELNEITISDITAKRFCSLKVEGETKKTVDVSQLKKGIYIAIIRTCNRFEVVKFIKK